MLITGASTGVGAALARMARDAGWRVTATMRNPDKARDLDGCHVAALDVGDAASIAAVVDDMMKREGRIDVLVANAGVGYVRNIEQSEPSDWRRVFETNTIGVMACTKAVLPHMRAARSGHVLVTSSVGGLVGQPFNEVYCASKFAIEGFVEALASYVTPFFGVNFTVVEPGGIKSEFSNSVMKDVGATGGMHQDEYLPILQRYMAAAQARGATEGVFQTPEQVAAVMLGVFDEKEPPVRVRTSEWAEQFTGRKTSPDPTGRDTVRETISTMLGDVSDVDPSKK